MKTEEQLRKEEAVIRRQLNRIEDEKRRKANSKLIGRCYKYWNSCGSDHPRW